jgi:septum formation protein
MLEPIRHILLKQRNILASGSPRRREILASVGLPVDIITSNFIENLSKDSFSHPCEYVKETAKQKAVEVWKRIIDTEVTRQASLVIGADTVVTMNDVIYEKPRDEFDAFTMLKTLSGRKHTVYTGVALVTPLSSWVEDTGDDGGSIPIIPPDSPKESVDYVVTTFHEATDVTMTEMSESIIRGYIATGEPFDKAGGYGIQGIGGSLIEGIRGDYFNVMGLPLHRLCKELFHMYSD